MKDQYLRDLAYFVILGALHKQIKLENDMCQKWPDDPDTAFVEGRIYQARFGEPITLSLKSGKDKWVIFDINIKYSTEND